jgi:DUF4097 and DUF4098 domain-containing protein YvlB
MRLHYALALTFLLAPLQGMAGALDAPDRPPSETPSPPQREKMIDQRFEVEAGGLLQVRVGDADVFVETGGTGVHVEVFLEGRDMDRARSYFESLRFRVEQEGNTIVVATDPSRERSGFWNQNGGARIQVRAHVPETFDADLNTSDGDIALERMEGRITARTSDGDVTVAQLSGPAIQLRTSDGDIRAEALQAETLTVQTSDGDLVLGKLLAPEMTLRTSDGDVRIDELEGRAELVTSDGDVDVGTARGPMLRLRTSDGTIRAEALYASRSEVRTSDGDIALEHASGDLEATTSSGDVRVGLTELDTVRLRTSDGDITIEVPGDARADVYLRGEDVRISSAFAFEGRVEEEEVDGMLNGGGSHLEASASNGTVILEAQ